MGIAYCCDKNKGITYEVWDGVVTGAQWLEHARSQVADRDWFAGSRSLTDLESVSADTSIGKAEIKQVAAIYGAHVKKIVTGKAAVVANKAFQQSPLFELFTSKHGLRLIVFNDVGTACKWLGIDAKEAEQSIKQLRVKIRSAANRQYRKGCKVE
jgi:hypothetical protein